GGLAAWLLRRPLVIHEQNAVAGLTNRLLARLAREVLAAFPGAFSAAIPARAIGNPVRREIVSIEPPEERFKTHGRPLRLLVLGGSQGALILNQTVPKALALIAPEERPDVWHQAGEKIYERALETYKQTGIDARLSKFIDDMPAAYSWADMVICRSGALTVSELAAAGLGAVLIPYPAAVDDHQTLNAEYLAEADAAVIIAQTELSPERLAQEIGRCLSDRELAVSRACRARELARPDATRELVEACLLAGAVS
ncbi:MAG: UDP-N-acetylglucosamine--N-acetylmuramyl-(pentapeptide) pyrophosphoryl-undecaprenol N-acetylglucosamine transferase, partial [Gammaproteobacteria bacterium]